MDLKKVVLNKLAETYHLSFDIEEKEQVGLHTLDIKLHDSDENYFGIQVSLRAKTRITLTCEPQQYAAEFVKLISKSTKQQRIVFTQYWHELQNKGKVTLKINDAQINETSFLDDDRSWNKFYLRYTEAPYFDAELDDEYEIVSRFVTIICGMMLSLINYEIEGYNEGKKEGSAHIVKSKRYERNPINRELCLLEKGYSCSVCGFNFEEVYGEIGKSFIHVHHSMPVHMMGDDYIVNPSKELFPICPNCHSMLHKKDPPYTVDELKSIMR